jgi:hypothetical protein
MPWARVLRAQPGCRFEDVGLEMIVNLPDAVGEEPEAIVTDYRLPASTARFSSSGSETHMHVRAMVISVRGEAPGLRAAGTISSRKLHLARY